MKFGWRAALSALAFVVAIASGAGATDPEHASGVARRVVTLSPHLAELVFAVGAGESLVGVSAYSDYPQAAGALPQVGDAFMVDQERLALLKPDLVLAWESGTPAATVDALRKQGYDVERVRTRSLADVAAAIDTIGRRTGRERSASAVRAKFEAQLAELSHADREAAPIRVFYQIAERPLYTVSGSHYASELIERCGGQNIFADLGDLAPMVSEEAVLARDPEVIIAGGDESLKDALFDQWRRWDGLAATRMDNFYVVNADRLGRPSNRLTLAGAEICAQLSRARNRRQQMVSQ